MKQQNESDKADGGVKKFKYVGPTKKETYSGAWSQDSGSSRNFFAKSASTGLDLDSVWSIKRNVTVSQAGTQPNKLYGQMVGGKRDNTSFGTTFYSRHKSISANANPTAKQLNNPTAQSHAKQKTWQRGSAHSTSNASSSPRNDNLRGGDVVSDEFDFDLLSPTSTKDKIPDSGFGQFKSSTSVQSDRNQTQDRTGLSFTSRYNSSSYLDF